MEFHSQKNESERVYYPYNGIKSRLLHLSRGKKELSTLKNEHFAAFFAWLAAESKKQSFDFRYSSDDTREGYDIFIQALLTRKVRSIDAWFADHGWNQFQQAWGEADHAERYLLTSFLYKLSLPQLAALLSLPSLDTLEDEAQVATLIQTIRDYYHNHGIADAFDGTFQNFSPPEIVHLARKARKEQFSLHDLTGT